MNVLHVYAHPYDPGSLNAALRSASAWMFASMGHAVADSDLHRMGFRPVLDERDFPDRALTWRLVPNIEIRHALERGTAPPDIAAELEKLRDADLVIVQFPLWWSSVPAILKGWLDRVLSFAFAADPDGQSRGSFLRSKKAMLVTTLEASEEVDPAGTQGGVSELLSPVSLNTLSYAGMTMLPTFIVYGATPEKDAEWTASQVERFKAHLVLVLTGL